MALNMALNLSWPAIADQMMAYAEVAMQAGVPSSALYTAAAGSCLIVPAACVYLYRKCIKGHSLREEAIAYLGNIHYYAGAPGSQYNERCIEMLQKQPTLVNTPLSESEQLSHGYTPFLRACWNNNVPLIHFMLQIGADIRLTNSDGESALYLVAYRVSKSSTWDPRALNLLWNAGCSVDDVNVHNNTMLHLAAKAGNSTLTRWLILHGADPEVANSAGYTPRRLALRKGSPAHLAVAELLQTSKDQERRKIVLRSDGILLTRLPRSLTNPISTQE